MNDETVVKIRNNSIIASNVWKGFLNSISNAEVFKECFHLRPTSKGITIVSTLLYAPMRGKNETGDNLLKTLNNLHKNLPQLLQNDQKASFDILNQFGFQKKIKFKRS